MSIADLISADPARMRVLELVRDLRLPDCWVAAGFVRSAVWDRLHERKPSLPDGDIDVIWFDGARADETTDAAIEAQLRNDEPALDWSVKNQARMHLRNADAPYASSEDAMRHWPETATAIGVRLTDGRIEIAAPYGLDDLFALILRPTPPFAGAKRQVFESRVHEKRWRDRWPKIALADA